MKFNGDANPLSDEGLENACLLLRIDAPTFWAFLRVESGGFGYLRSRRPRIRFERHLFHELTAGKFDAVDPEVSNPAPGGYIGGQHEYARLDHASRLDASAALQSTSWGIGQVMGCHFASLGFRTIEQMVQFMCNGEDEQLMAMARFMSDESIDYSLRERNWDGVAEAYRRANLPRPRQVEQLAAAYSRYALALPNLDVRGAQAALLFLGFDPGPVDGMIGPRTRSALMAFQRKRRYAITGRLDQRTIDYLINITFDMMP